MTDWTKAVGVILSLGTLLVSITYSFAQRPTDEKVERMIDQRQAPVASAVQQQTQVLRELTQQLQQLREQSIRQEVRRELERREDR